MNSDVPTTIPSFASFLVEGDQHLTHLTHLEDVLLDDGRPGLDFIQTILEEFYHILQGGGVSKSIDLRTKWDGAPSVVFGPDPADGQFFVATKSAFNKTPKLMKTHAQIAAAYGTGGPATALHNCLRDLQLLAPTRVLQGDLLFTGAVATQTIDGRDYHTFRPNTILYAIDVTSNLGQRIAKASLGIVIHTMYAGSGSRIADYRAVPVTPQIFSQLQRTTRVVAIDNTYDDVSGTATFTTGEEHDFLLAWTRFSSLAKTLPVSVTTAMSQEPLHSIVQQFLNARVRAGDNQTGFARADALLEYLNDYQTAEMGKRSTAAGKSAVTTRLSAALNFVAFHRQDVAHWFMTHQAITHLKLLIVRKLEQASTIGTFIPTANGLQSTGHEGYVAVSHTGRMVKLVDRLSFSRANFLTPKAWA